MRARTRTHTHPGKGPGILRGPYFPPWAATSDTPVSRANLSQDILKLRLPRGRGHAGARRTVASKATDKLAGIGAGTGETCTLS